MNNVIIYGVGDFARTLLEYMRSDNGYNIIAFCVDDTYYDESKFMTYPVITYSDLLKMNKSEFSLLTAVGYSNMRARKDLYIRLKREGFNFINFIHNTVSSESGVEYGENNIILQRVIVEPNVKIGSNNIIWSNVTLCHDCVVNNHNFIAAGTTVGGFSRVMETNFIGFDSTILHNVTLEKEIIVGAKSLVKDNLENYSKNFGIPTRVIGYHEEIGIKIK